MIKADFNGTPNGIGTYVSIINHISVVFAMCFGKNKSIIKSCFNSQWYTSENTTTVKSDLLLNSMFKYH